MLIIQDLTVCITLMLSSWKLRRIARSGQAYNHRHYISFIIFLCLIFAFYLFYYSKNNQMIPFRESFARAYFSIYLGLFMHFMLSRAFRTEQLDLNNLYLKLIENQFIVFGLLSLVLLFSIGYNIFIQ